MKKIKFSDILPGQVFGPTKDTARSNVKIKGWAVTCIPGEEYGNEPFNAISLTDGRPRTFDDNADVYIEVEESYSLI